MPCCGSCPFARAPMQRRGLFVIALIGWGISGCLVTAHLMQSSSSNTHGVKPPQDALEYLQSRTASITCTSPTISKQSCLTHNVCLVFGSLASSDPQQVGTLSVVRLGGMHAVAPANADDILSQHLSTLLQSYGQVHFVKAADVASAAVNRNNTAAETIVNLWNSNIINAVSRMSAGRRSGRVKLTRSPHRRPGHLASVYLDDAVTVISRTGYNQYSFGHALGNFAMPIYLMLLNHMREDEIPSNFQLLVAAGAWEHAVFPMTLKATLSHNVHLLPNWLSSIQKDGHAGVCFRNLLLGDGGYIQTSSDAEGGRAEAQHFSTRPTFFASSSWESFKRHAFKVAGVLQSSTALHRALVVLNDKAYYDPKDGQLHDDRRMILNIHELADKARAAYTFADVLVVRFRDYAMADQIKLMASASVFITTAGSSSHMCVFLPKGASTIVIGGPVDQQTKQLPPWSSFTPFDELDRWFPLAYVHFERYETDINDTNAYKVRKVEGHWQPQDPVEQARWWNYNADVQVDFNRLQPMLSRALHVP